jgi:hypothetical protein
MIDGWQQVLPAYEPTNWFGLAAIIVGGVATVATSAFAAWGTFKARRETSQLTEQITNGHKTIFRDDFDALVQYLSELGEDLRQERKDRRRDVNELRQDIDRRFDDLSQRINQAVDRRQG